MESTEITNHLTSLSTNNPIPRDHYDYLIKLKNEYGFEPKVIYDIGSCVLYWTKIAAEIWPNAEIYLFEGMDSVEFLYKELGYKYNIGVLSDVDGKEVTFYQNNESPGGNSYYKEQSSYSNKLYGKDSERIVKTETVDGVVKTKGFKYPDLIKIDVQGCEIDILNGMPETIRHCKHLIVELQHEQYNFGAPLNTESVPIIDSMGFDLVTPLFCNNGPDGDYHFEKRKRIKRKLLIYTGYCDFTPIDVHTRGVGGAETAIIDLSLSFINIGYDVTIATAHTNGQYSGVKYVSLDKLQILLDLTKFDVVIVSRYANFFKLFKQNIKLIYIWLHDFIILDWIEGKHLPNDGHDLLLRYRNKISGIVCLTEWHKKYILETYPELNSVPHYIIGNGINDSTFPKIPQQKQKNRFYWSSRPERGLYHMLSLMPLIREKLPDAELYISCYCPEDIKNLKETIESVEGCYYLGSLSKVELHYQISISDIWLYPTKYYETFCITALEMMMCKVLCIGTDLGGLTDTIGNRGVLLNYFLTDEEIVEILLKTINNSEDYRLRAYDWVINETWNNKALEWRKIMNSKKTKKKKTTIALTGIVKNESNVILKMLNSVLPIIDYYAIVDTGSTDGTQEIIRNFFKEKHIPGEVIEHPMKRFIAEEARNIGVEAIKNKADYGFTIDADDHFIIGPTFNVDEFKTKLSEYDGMFCYYSYGGYNHHRMSFFSTTLKWIWHGPRHECLTCDDENLNIGTATNCYIHQSARGSSWTDITRQQKYEEIANDIKDYIARGNTGSRWIFYLAQSYLDAGTEKNFKKALSTYKKRVTLTEGYWEEIYVSYLKIAGLLSLLKYPNHKIIDAYLLCGKYNSYRAEHLIPVILYYHSISEYDIAYIYSLYAMKFAGISPIPKSTLFIDSSIYTWKIYDLHSISCWRTNRGQEGKDAFEKLWAQVELGNVPEEDIQRLTANSEYFK